MGMKSREPYEEQTPVPEADSRLHGREAEAPEDIPRAGWRDVLTRVWHQLDYDDVSLISAGLAMHALLAVLPMLAVTVALYGVFRSPADVINDMNEIVGILPPDTLGLFGVELQRVASGATGALSLTAAVAMLVRFGAPAPAWRLC